jgi:hypothetical protein
MIRAALLLPLALISGVRSAGAQNLRFEMRAVVYGVPTSRDATLSPTSIGHSSGTMTGGEFSLRGSGIGLMIRLLNGTLSPSNSGGGGRLTTGEARVQLGSRLFAAEGGFARRALGGPIGTTVYTYVRAGATSIIDIGGTGLSARIAGAVYLAGQGVPNTKVSGHEVVTALEYAAHHLPFVGTIGYRSEVFEPSGGGLKDPERVSGLVVGIGLRLAH